MSGKPMYKAICSVCGKPTIVPFKPRRGGKGITCHECWKNQQREQEDRAYLEAERSGNIQSDLDYAEDTTVHGDW